jgi:hypothetical protein
MRCRLIKSKIQVEAELLPVNGSQMQTKESLCMVMCARFMNCKLTPAVTRSSKVFAGNGTKLLALPPSTAFGTAIAADDEDAAGAAAASDKESKNGTQPASRADAEDLAAGEK